MRLSKTRGFKPEEWSTPNTYDLNFKSLPRTAGIYLIVCRTFSPGRVAHRVSYVGMSLNIEQRCKRHEMLLQIEQDIDAAKPRDEFSFTRPCIFFREYAEDLRAIERAFIRKFNPDYNIVHRRRGA